MICHPHLSLLLSTLFVVISTFGSLAKADEFEHEFSSSTALAPAFVIRFDPRDKRFIARDGLRIHHQARSGDLTSFGLKTVFAIRGDGETRLDFTNTELQTPDSGEGSGVFFDIEFVGEEERKITVGRQAERDGSQFVLVRFKLGSKSKSRTSKYPIGIAPVLAEPSGFVVSRTGDIVRVGVVVDEQRIELAERECPTADIFPIGIRLTTGGAASDLDVTLKRLKVTGAGLPSDSLVPPEPMSRWKLFALLFIATLCFSAFAWIRKHTRAT